MLGGTGLSNPVKHFSGIEPVKLRGKRVAGGYTVKGVLPWVSNLGPDHHFGAVFELEDKPGHFVMAIVPCASEGLTLAQNTQFVALDGTRTFAVQMRDVFISDDVDRSPIRSTNTCNASAPASFCFRRAWRSD